MKKPQILALTTLLALTCSTFATPQLRLSDGVTTITVTDGDANDQAPEPGVVTYIGPVGPKWNVVNVTVGITKPDTGTASDPYMDLNTFNQSTAAGDLTVMYTETGFTVPSGTWDAEGGGTSDGTAELQYFLDSNITPFGTNTLLADFPGLTDVYNPSNAGPFNITAPYSMTLVGKFHHNSTGNSAFDSQLILTPSQQQPPSVQCAGDRDLGCNPTDIVSCDTNSIVVNATCGVSNITCSVGGPDIVTGCVHERDLVYTVTDNCGQSASCTQHIYWTVDTTAPSFTLCAGDQNLGCNPTTIPDCDLSKVAASDDCGRVVINCGSVDSVDGCGHLRTITYTATDSCGNSATCVQHISWTVDTTAPSFTQCAGDRDLGCNPTTIPDCDTNSVSATDDCSTPTITCSSVDATNNCSRSRTITYVATDACGNSSSCVQTLTWTVDTTAPTFTKCPADADLGCNPTTIPDCDTTPAEATDTCSAPKVTCSKSDVVNGCSHVRTITYIATDACGNTASCVQHVTWTVDTTAPTFTKKPSDVSLLCAPAVIPTGDLSAVTATDECSTATVTFAVSDDTTGCTATRTITYTATDSCGNKSTFAQHISWNTCTGGLGDFVWNDKNHNGIQDAGEPGIIGMTVNLHDCSGGSIIQTTTTDTNGLYLFTNLSACSQYYVEFVIPTNTSYVFTTPHAGGSTTSNDSNANETGNHGPGTTACYSIVPGQTNYTVDAGLYIPVPPPTNIGHGDTATIGFWNNKNGQAVILAQPNSPALGNWLGTNYPCLFGNLTGQPNSVVAAQFQTYFQVKGQKTYAQVMAGALADYVTSTTLAGTTGTGAAKKFGFNISTGGTGGKGYNVGSYGTVLGLSNNTVYTVSQLLQAAQTNCPWSAGAFDALNTIFSGINQSGDIN
jgi:hypothetical protein